MGLRFIFDDGGTEYVSRLDPYFVCDICSKRLNKSNLRLLSSTQRFGTYMVCSEQCKDTIEKYLNIRFREFTDYFIKIRLLKNLGFKAKDFGGE